MGNQFKIDESLYTAMHKCTRCGQCTYGKEEAEFRLICPLYIKGNFFTYSAGGIMQLARAIFEGKLSLSESVRDILYLCTTCGACEVNCGIIEGQVELFNLLKKELVRNEIPLLEPHRILVENILKRKSPYSGRLPRRDEWLPKEKRERLSSRSALFYYVGCVSSFMETDIPAAFVSILDKLHTPFTISDDEWCCGAPLYFSGHEEKVYDIVKHNAELIEESGASTLVCTCPTCSMIFKKYYPRWLERDLNFEVLHSTELLERLHNDGRLKLDTIGGQKRAIYHDPCHLGRGQEIYDSPRRIIDNVKGIQLKELPLSKENSLCCGGGGLVPTGFSEFSDDLALKRTSEIGDMGAELLVSACPACKENLKIAAKRLKFDVEVIDIAELIDAALK